MEGVDILERIRKSEARDNKVVKTVEEIKKAGVKMLRERVERRGQFDAEGKEGVHAQRQGTKGGDYQAAS